MNVVGDNDASVVQGMQSPCATGLVIRAAVAHNMQPSALSSAPVQLFRKLSSSVLKRIEHIRYHSLRFVDQ